MLKFMANTRKFGMTSIFMTPTIINLVPKIRNLPLHPEKPGYCDVHWVKSRSKSNSLVQSSKMNIDPDHVVWVRSAMLMDDEVYRDEPEPMIIKYTSWANTKKEDLKVGEYAYSTRSVADFEVGENKYGVPFDFKAFLKAVSKCDEEDVPERIEAFFEEWDRKGSEDDDGTYDDEHEFASEIKRAREIDITWNDISYVTKKSPSTLVSILKRHYPEMFSQKKKTASNSANCENKGVARADIYKTLAGEDEGHFDPSSRKDQLSVMAHSTANQ
jgi:hypothetical protein